MEEKKSTWQTLVSDDKNRLLDLNGVATGVPMNKKNLITIILCIVGFFAIRALPLQAYGELTSTALAVVVVAIAIMIVMNDTVNLIFPCIGLAVVGMFLNLWDYKTLTSQIAGSPFNMMFGMIVVGLGCEYTPMGKRITYYMLKKFGQKPATLVIAIGAVSTILSSFVSNNAVIVMMSGICATMLVEMNQVPGESKLGKSIMLVIAAASMIGGAGLINGCPVANGMGISLLTEASGGVSNISYLDWAKIGVPSALLCILPMGLVYSKFFGVKNSDIENLPDPAIFSERLAELGPVTGSEIRWVLIVVGMVASMSFGMSTPKAALLWALIAMCPVIGVVPSTQVLKRIPWSIMIAVMFIPVIGLCFTTHGLADIVVEFAGPLFQGMSPFVFCLVATIFHGIMSNIMLNAHTPVLAMDIAFLTPICMSLGYNPSVVLLPILFINSCFFVFGFEGSMMLNHEYGYWEMSEPTIPGCIMLLICSVIFAVCACFIGPLFGMPLYL